MSEKLIDAVRCHTVLYDSNHPDYIKCKIKNEIWDEIAKKLNLKDGSEAKNAWMKLRNCHRDALRRRKKCLKSGVPLRAIKKWKFQKQMEFLMSYMASNSYDTNIRSDSESEESQINESAYIENYDTVIVKNENIEIENEKNENVETDETVEIAESTPKEMKENDVETLLKMVLQQQEHRTQGTSLEGKKSEEEKAPNDHLYYFFMSMYDMTKRMPPARQHYIKNKIFQTVSQVEGELLNINTSHGTHSQQCEFPHTLHSTSQFQLQRYLSNHSHCNSSSANISRSHSPNHSPVPIPLPSSDNDTKDICLSFTTDNNLVDYL